MDDSEIFESFDEANDAAEKTFRACLADSGQRYALRAGREAARASSLVTDWYHRVTRTRRPRRRSCSRCSEISRGTCERRSAQISSTNASSTTLRTSSARRGNG